MVYTFHVDGVPQPKGSTKAFWRPGMKHAVVTADNTKTRPWAALVRDAATQAVGSAIVFARGAPVALELRFVLPRPQSLPKRVAHHTRKPDLDKLARAVKDALTGVVWQDDSQVVELLARKGYAAGDARPGLQVIVRKWWGDTPGIAVEIQPVVTTILRLADSPSLRRTIATVDPRDRGGPLLP